nr:hypothetical protein [Kofleriaceae bacterium]
MQELPTLIALSLSLSLSVSPAFAKPKGNSDADISAANSDLGFMAMNEKDLAHSGALHMTKKFLADAAACSASAKARLDGGESADTVVKVKVFPSGSAQVKLGDAEATVCKVVADKGKDWDARVKAAHDNVGEAAAAPYKAVGIGGDKLAFLTSLKGDFDLYGVGAVLLKTPESVKAASLLFILSGGGSGAKWTLYRHAFDGDKSAGTTQRDFVDRPDAKAYQ